MIMCQVRAWFVMIEVTYEIASARCLKEALSSFRYLEAALRTWLQLQPQLQPLDERRDFLFDDRFFFCHEQLHEPFFGESCELILVLVTQVGLRYLDVGFDPRF